MSFMTMLTKKFSLPGKDEALPGRDAAIMPVEPHFVNGKSMTGPYPEGMKTVLVGMGCFWGAERLFWQLPGVYVTAVGYAGGYTANPTYHETCTGRTGHTEAVLVVYDPAVIGLEEVLKVFWENHDPTQGMRQGNDTGTQYRSAVYVGSAEDLELALKTRDAYQTAPFERWRIRVDHHRDPRTGYLLFRRGLSSAVSGKEPGWLLRHWRHRRFLPDRDRSAGLIRTKTHMACGGLIAAGRALRQSIRKFDREACRLRQSVSGNSAKKLEISFASQR